MTCWWGFWLVYTYLDPKFNKLCNSSKSNQWEHDSFTKFPIESATYESEQILKENPASILKQNI